MPGLVLAGDVIVVCEVVGQLLDPDVGEPGLPEHPFGLLFAPHRAEAGAALRERVIQCIVEMVYMSGPSRWSMLLWTWLEPAMSCIR